MITIKLPDFSFEEGFNDLRKRMNAPLIQNWEANMDWKKIDIKLRTQGIIVDPNEIEQAKDGTLEYKGRKVLVYIRDWRVYKHNTTNLPKFHVAWCLTLNTMKNEGRYEKRYVVTTRIDGKFIINQEVNNEVNENLEVELNVCKHCLSKLYYKEYNHKNKIAKRDIYENFNIQDFFDSYKSTKISQLPLFNEYNAPRDEYSDDWEEISIEYRSLKNWKCELCKKDYSENKKDLHVHHINGNRSDNRLSNLKVLCIYCHSMQPRHQHMKRR